MLIVGKKPVANGLGRWLAFALSLFVAAGMVYEQSHEHRSHGQTQAAPVVGTAPASAAAAAAGVAPHTATPGEAQALAAAAATAPVAAQDFQFALPTGRGSEEGLQVKTIWAERAISLLFPQIVTIGGYRQDALQWHPNGLAIDVMIPNHSSEEGIELGNQIAGYALANAKRWGILHVIWRQKIYPGIGSGSWTADLGNETLNHYDHVHIATNGGGYPTGHETYYIGSMNPMPPN